jgi:hypothetical protein
MSAFTDSPERFMYVCGFASTTRFPATVPTASFARDLFCSFSSVPPAVPSDVPPAAAPNTRPSSAAKRSRTSNPTLCLVRSNLDPGLPRPTISQRAGSSGARPSPPVRTRVTSRMGKPTTARTAARGPIGGRPARATVVSFGRETNGSDLSVTVFLAKKF